MWRSFHSSGQRLHVLAVSKLGFHGRPVIKFRRTLSFDIDLSSEQIWLVRIVTLATVSLLGHASNVLGVVFICRASIIFTELVVDRLIVSDVEQVNKFCTIRDEEEQADSEDAVRRQGHDRIIYDPHEQERRNEETAQLRNEEVEAVIGFLLQSVHRDIHRFIRFFAHQSPLRPEDQRLK